MPILPFLLTLYKLWKTRLFSTKAQLCQGVISFCFSDIACAFNIQVLFIFKFHFKKVTWLYHFLAISALQVASVISCYSTVICFSGTTWNDTRLSWCSIYCCSTLSRVIWNRPILLISGPANISLQNLRKRRSGMFQQPASSSFRHAILSGCLLLGRSACDTIEVPFIYTVQGLWTVVLHVHYVVHNTTVCLQGMMNPFDEALLKLCLCSV